MPRPLRLSFVALGLALAVYGVASLTGGWLGTPPWWERNLTSAESFELSMNGLIFSDEGVRPGPGREWGSGAAIAVGAGLVACGAWPRRRALTGTRV